MQGETAGLDQVADIPDVSRCGSFVAGQRP
jgi:hypothetical protein